jgi:hypothetical protein
VSRGRPTSQVSIRKLKYFDCDFFSHTFKFQATPSLTQRSKSYIITEIQAFCSLSTFSSWIHVSTSIFYLTSIITTSQGGCLRVKGWNRNTLLGQQQQWEGESNLEQQGVWTGGPPGDLHVAIYSSLPEGLLVWAEVQVAPSSCLRPQQRLRGNLHGLVPLPFLLCLQVCQEPFFDAGLIWTKPTSQTSQPHQKHQFYDDNKFLKMWSSLCWWFDLPNAVTSVPPCSNAKCLILASNALNLPFLWTVVVVFSRSC